MPPEDHGHLPQKPSFLDYLETFLPFRIPRIPLPQTAKNLDKAFARLIDGASIDRVQRARATLAEEKARSSARIRLIDAGADAVVRHVREGALEFEQRAINAAIGEIACQQRNKERVIEIAARELQENPPQENATEEIDSDWLNMFSNFASQKSREDVQSLWGKLLAGEIRKPGSFSLGTLQRLSAISASDATFIHAFMQFVANGDVMYGGKSNEFISVEDGLRLEHLEVTHPGSLNYLEYKLSANSTSSIRLQGNRAIQIKSVDIGQVDWHGVIYLTPFGKDL